LPGDYTYAEKSWPLDEGLDSWGVSRVKLFYKIHYALQYPAAKIECESDGAVLAIPRSEAENDFIADLIPNERIWIGINDMDQEGLFVGVDGSQISWTKWAPGQPDQGLGEDGVEIVQGIDGQTIPKSWNDAAISDFRRFVCLRYIHIESIG